MIDVCAFEKWISNKLQIKTSHCNMGSTLVCFLSKNIGTLSKSLSAVQQISFAVERQLRFPGAHDGSIAEGRSGSEYRRHWANKNSLLVSGPKGWLKKKMRIWIGKSIPNVALKAVFLTFRICSWLCLDEGSFPEMLKVLKLVLLPKQRLTIRDPACLVKTHIPCNVWILFLFWL